MHFAVQLSALHFAVLVDWSWRIQKNCWLRKFNWQTSDKRNLNLKLSLIRPPMLLTDSTQLLRNQLLCQLPRSSLLQLSSLLLLQPRFSPLQSSLTQASSQPSQLPKSTQPLLQSTPTLNLSSSSSSHHISHTLHWFLRPTTHLFTLTHLTTTLQLSFHTVLPTIMLQLPPTSTIKTGPESLQTIHESSRFLRLKASSSSSVMSWAFPIMTLTFPTHFK